MAGLEWNILAGAITAAFGSGVAWAAVKVGYGTRISNVEKFVDRYPNDEAVKCSRCHDELLSVLKENRDEMRENRREQQEQFGQLNARLDKVITFRRRNGEKENSE